MKQRLRGRELALIGSMLFGLFFGAGNLIFPVILGAKAGANLLPALIGMLITAVGFPLLGIVAIGISHSEGLPDLAGKVSPAFRLLFTCALYLTIGPLFAIPRCGATSFTIGVLPLTDGAHTALYQFIFTLCFFAVVLAVSLRPGKVLDSVGRWLNPAFLLFFGLLLAAALLHPAGAAAEITPVDSYAENALAGGFLQGYDTLDVLAGLAFGILVVRSIRSLGATEPSAVAGSTVRAGALSMALMALIYTLTALVGAQSYPLYADRMADSSFTGGDALAIIARYYFGGAGSVLLAVIVTLCCLKTAIGLVTSCSETFAELFPHSLSYRAWAVVFSAGALLVSNIGLSGIISLSAPVLYFLYPLAIVLVLLGIFGALLGLKRPVYQWAIRFTLVAAVLDLARVSGLPALGGLVSLGTRFLPFYTAGLGWILPAVLGTAVGLIVSGKGERAARIL